MSHYSQYGKSHYERNKEKYVQKARKHKEAIGDLVWGIKCKGSCVDCGESDPLVLDFDHVRGKKKFSLGRAYEHGRLQVLDELAKCEIRCANCHRRKTLAPVVKRISH